MKTTKVLLITGYLGSGKTTLLNRILNNNRGIRFAVIVNDIGEVNIDADLIQKGGIVDQQDDSLIALQNGCICCSLKMDLIQQMRDIIESERFDYIVIEASGICEPAPIAQTICAYEQSIAYSEADPVEIDHITTLDCICSVVDALRLKDEFNSGLDLTGNTLAEEDIVNTLVATDYKDPPTVTEEPYYIVRRLTPTECARLQGFPDWWCAGLETEEPAEEEIEFWREVFETHRLVTGSAAKPKTRVQIVKWLKDPHADSAEYKLWGNGVALPCVCFVLAGIVYYDQFKG